jgi:signal transduction histidine kinase
VAVALLSMVVGSVLSFTRGSAQGSVFDLIFVLMGLVFGVVGALVAARRPDNPIGWIFIAVAVGLGLLGTVEDLLAGPGGGTSTRERLSAWLEGWTWVPLVFVPTTFPLLLFPDGHPPSQRWRWLVWAAAIGIIGFAFSMAFDPDNYREWARAHGEPNPLGIAPPGWLAGAVGLATLLLVASVIGAGASVVVRFRRSEGIERQQLTWLAYAGVIAATSVGGSFIVGGILDTFGLRSTTVDNVSYAVIILAVLSIPVTMGIAILRYRLYEIDVVIKKTIVFAILVALIMVVALVLLLASSSLVTPLAPDETQAVGITGVVIGLLVWPLRRLAGRIADRLVFGGRASPYEVLSEFAGRVGGTYAADDVLQRMAQILGSALGAEHSTVWLLIDDRPRPVASWPAGGEHDAEPMAPMFEVRHQGEVLGMLTVRLPANDPMNASKEKLARDLAAQAGPVLRNVVLVEELRESRRRIVAAQDERARKLERNIHDGAQQQLVALAVRAKLAQTLVAKDPTKAEALLGELQSGITESLENLRDLARGIYPPLLADRGLAAALEAQARKSSVPVQVNPDGIGRYPQEVEAAVYFSVLEALQNVAKYASADRATVSLADSNGDLTFEIVDDGVGFDPAVAGRGTGLQGIADRLAAIGGSLEVRSAPGDGTTVAGRLPVGGAHE